MRIAVRIVLAAWTALAFFLGAAIFLEHCLTQLPAWEKVYRDGRYIGMVPARASVVTAMRSIADGYGLSIAFAPVHASVPAGYDWRRVAELPVPAAAITVDGRPVVYTRNLQAANTVLQQVRRALIPAGIRVTSVHFVRRVGVRPAVVGALRVQTVRRAVHAILYPDARPLASRAEFLRIPGVARSLGADAVRPAGRQADVHPLLDVVATAAAVRVVRVPYPVHYVATDRLPRGQVRVIRRGTPGQVRQRVLIRYINGRAVGQEVVGTATIRKAEPEVALRGTNDGIAQGEWVWPTDSHFITSPFGPRILGGRYEFHPGVDIACPIGSPVYATNDGQVIDAGWNSGGYGNWVLIDNGRGVETVFGHLSRVMVHAGQVVAKGQLIGYSGETGEATGPHLHYEVRLNGRPVSPTPYM
ncbi:hypothetical protein GCM10010885_13720 [Alicyclobacillus cellulosilyticus]|uniref:G5 domain-containing protein n=1 Tax=Alicyclobacillus cellulosilyticus TaxID=1003997 RepID=A0A917NJT6_9BACL|nr:peptidoglycan DD-metalloendopeptidase family protein [Alicyclobacillus cellulosilyticus]GGJ05809.1 hypothetical protein GCM10010885_13720 [Alicyclobacillus cellulosilyticus]